jgi:hypothetical protein
MPSAIHTFVMDITKTLTVGVDNTVCVLALRVLQLGLSD